jgi:hypothetical protein
MGAHRDFFYKAMPSRDISFLSNFTTMVDNFDINIIRCFDTTLGHFTKWVDNLATTISNLASSQQQYATL